MGRRRRPSSVVCRSQILRQRTVHITVTRMLAYMLTHVLTYMLPHTVTQLSVSAHTSEHVRYHP